MNLGGIRVIASPHVAPIGTELPHADWRQRLARNLAAPRRAGVWPTWEPLTYCPPNVFLLGGDVLMHPKSIAAMTLFGGAENPHTTARP